MADILQLSEMQTKYAGEWILVGDPVTDDSLEVVRGNVLFHSKDRDEVYRFASREHPRRYAILCTARIAEDAAVVL